MQSAKSVPSRLGTGCLAAFLTVSMLLASAGPATAKQAVAEPGRAAAPSALELRSNAVLVLDDRGHTVFAKNPTAVKPIASITKLMTAMVVLDAGLPMNEVIQITRADRDGLRNSSSRLATERARLTRGDLLLIALMSSENRAASALGRTTLPGGTTAFVEAMNRKARALGMTSSRFADATGLDGGNVSTAEDLARLVRAAAGYPLIHAATTRAEAMVHPYGDSGGALGYRNTNPLVRNPAWQVELSKTGYVSEAGRCLVMQARIGGRTHTLVLLDSFGKLSPVGDSNRLRKWIEGGGKLAVNTHR